jgi:hypothetical protein
MKMEESANLRSARLPHFCRPKDKNSKMKHVRNTHRILAVLMGIAIVAILVVQIVRDGRALSEARAKQEQQLKIGK